MLVLRKAGLGLLSSQDAILAGPPLLAHPLLCVSLVPMLTPHCVPSFQFSLYTSCTPRCAGGRGLPGHVRERSHLDKRGRCAGKAQHAARKHSMPPARQSTAPARRSMAMRLQVQPWQLLALPRARVHVLVAPCSRSASLCSGNLISTPPPLHFTALLAGTMAVLAGSTLGGGTRINWCASFKTPPHVRWARCPCNCGLAGTRGSMQLWQHVYVQACTCGSVHSIGELESGRNMAKKPPPANHWLYHLALPALQAGVGGAAQPAPVCLSRVRCSAGCRLLPHRRAPGLQAQVSRARLCCRAGLPAPPCLTDLMHRRDMLLTLLLDHLRSLDAALRFGHERMTAPAVLLPPPPCMRSYTSVCVHSSPP